MKKLTLLGVPVSKLDTLKYVIQLRSIVWWKRFGGKGTVQAATAVGKTYIAFTLIKKMEKLYKNGKSTIVVVPTSALRDQWEKDVRSLGLNNVKVFVINTVARVGFKESCDLLVLDEMHQYASDVTKQSFFNVFRNIKYTWILGLTATLERLDGLHTILAEKAPVCFKISQKEAIANGWIADGVVLNVPVFLTRLENENIKKISKQVSYYVKKFGDFGIMQSCMNARNARTYALNNYPQEDPDSKAKEIVKWAVQGDRAVRERKEFLYNCEHKISATVELLNEFNCKSITFSQSIKFADTIQERIGSECVVYHSQIPSADRKYKKSKLFKTLKGAQSFADRNGYNPPISIEGGHAVKWFAKKRLSGSSIAKDNVNKFIAGKKRVMSTAKGLDTGFNDERIQLGVDAARTSSPTSMTQKTGRVLRLFKYKDGTDKKPVYVSLYVPDTTDEKWLRAAQKNMDFQVWCEDLDEAKQIIHKVLDKQIGKV